MKKLLTIVAVAASLVVTGCAGQPDPCDQAPNKAECQAWGEAGGDINDYLVGGMIGYMLASSGGRTVIVQDSSYRGPYRKLSRPLLSKDRQIAKLEQKVKAQKAELKRQQAYRSSSSYRSSTSSYRSSSFSSGRSGRR